MEGKPTTIESNEVSPERWEEQQARASKEVEDLVAQYEGDLEGLSGALYSKLQEIAETNDNKNRFLAEALAGELWLVEKQIKLSQINPIAEAA